MRVNVRSGNQHTTLFGKIVGTIFLAIFASAGGAFGFFMLQTLLPSQAAWRFDPTPCLVTTSQVWTAPSETAPDAPAPETASPAHRYRFEITYRYTAGDREHNSNVYQLDYDGSDKLSEVEQLARTFPPGTEATCYVDPDDPARAVFARTSAWPLLVLVLPLIFVLVGVGGIITLWRSGGPKRDAQGRERRAAISEKAKGSGTGCLVGFFAIFAAAGLLFMVPFFALPAWLAWSARSWNEVPCTIERSAVGDHGDTYSVEVLYRYEVDGRGYHGERYHFFTGSTSGYSGKAEIVERLPVGTVTTCYVDPNDPSSAVIQRRLSNEMWFGLIPGIFVLVGVGGMVGTLIAARRRSVAGDPAARWLPGLNRRDAGPAGAPVDPGLGGRGLADPHLQANALTADPDAPLVIEPQASPLGKIIGAVLLAVVVNALVGTMGWFAVLKPWRAGGDVEGCLVLFMIPFSLVGLGLLLNVPYQILAAFNPRPHLEIHPAPLALGQASHLTWRWLGASSRISHLTLTLSAREEATYRVGTRTSTATSTFHREVLIDTRDFAAISAGALEINLPIDSMCSFSADRNKVVWKLDLAGEIDRWPDVSESFELAVAPAATRGSRR